MLTRDFTISGSYFNSRMIGNYIYTIVSQPAYILDDAVILPRLYTADKTLDVKAEQIYYSGTVDYYYTDHLLVLHSLKSAKFEIEYQGSLTAF